MRKYVYDVFFTYNSNTIYVQKLDLNDHVQYCYREVYTVLFFVIVLLYLLWKSSSDMEIVLDNTNNINNTLDKTNWSKNEPNIVFTRKS